MTVMRYRSSALVTFLSSLNTGRPVGTKITSSRSYTHDTSEAATKWPLWMGSNVPPMMPTRRRVCQLPRAESLPLPWLLAPAGADRSDMRRSVSPWVTATISAGSADSTDFSD